VSSLHQTEAMIALLLCEYQNRPDWVYLTSYGNPEMKNAAKAIISGDFGTLTNGVDTSAEAFVKGAVFATWDFSTTEVAEVWAQSVRDIAWVIGHVAERFVDWHENNAYKHGLRVVSGRAGLSVSGPSSTGGFMPIISMQHSLSYLQISEGTNGYVGSRVTKEISPEYSFELIHCMAAVLSLVKEMRLARINRALKEEINLPQIDREGLQRLIPAANFSFPY
jgi:hypothetical protein